MRTVVLDSLSSLERSTCRGGAGSLNQNANFLYSGTQQCTLGSSPERAFTAPAPPPPLRSLRTTQWRLRFCSPRWCLAAVLFLHESKLQDFSDDLSPNLSLIFHISSQIDQMIEFLNHMLCRWIINSPNLIIDCT